MFNRTYLSILLYLLTSLALCQQARSADYSAAKTVVDKALTSLQDGSYESFTAEASPMFTKGFPVGVFKAMSQDLAPRLKTGFEAVYLGTLNFNGANMYLFKVTVKDKGSDMLIKILLDSGGKIDGFTID